MAKIQENQNWKEEIEMSTKTKTEEKKESPVSTAFKEPDPNIWFKEITFIYLGIDSKPNGDKYVKAEEFDFYVDENLVCRGCGTNKFVYLHPTSNAINRHCFRCGVTMSIGKAFGVLRRTFEMSPDEAIRILKGRNASKGFLSRFTRPFMKEPYRIPRKRPKSKR